MFLDKDPIFDIFQCGFGLHHSTESALLKVHNNITRAVDLTGSLVVARPLSCF